MSKITIVMPTYNQGRFIKEAIDSILAQTLTDFKLIVVDDGSTDNTAEIVNGYKDSRVSYIKKKNGGTGSALNLGFDGNDSEYETWFASDNRMYPTALEDLAKVLDDKPEIDFVYGNCEIGIMDKSGTKELSRRNLEAEVGQKWDKETPLKKHYFLGIAWLWRTSLHRQVGDFWLHPCEDYDFAVRCAELTDGFYYLPKCLGWFRRHDDNLSHKLAVGADRDRYCHMVQSQSLARDRGNAVGLRILILSLEFDCAGVGWTLKQAINKYTNHRATHLMRRASSVATNTDFLFKDISQVIPYIQQADVIHFNQWIWTHRPGEAFSFLPVNEYGAGNPFEHYFRGKKIIFHLHGGYHQLNPQYWINECKRVGATMLRCDPLSGNNWIPNIVASVPNRKFDAVFPLKIAIMGDLGDPRRNNRIIKSSLDYLSAYYRIEYKFFGGLSYEESIRERSEYHISIDSLTQGFIGMWGWESLALGQVLIARLSPDTERQYARIGAKCPISNVDNVDSMAEIIRYYCDKPLKLRNQFDTAKEWIKMYYTPEKIVKRYIDTYKNTGICKNIGIPPKNALSPQIAIPPAGIRIMPEHPLEREFCGQSRSPMPNKRTVETVITRNREQLGEFKVKPGGWYKLPGNGGQ